MQDTSELFDPVELIARKLTIENGKVVMLGSQSVGAPLSVKGYVLVPIMLEEGYDIIGFDPRHRVPKIWSVGRSKNIGTDVSVMVLQKGVFMPRIEASDDEDRVLAIFPSKGHPRTVLVIYIDQDDAWIDSVRFT